MCVAIVRDVNSIAAANKKVRSSLRIVLDTNVLASWVFFSGPSATILVAMKSGRIRLVLTPEVI